MARHWTTEERARQALLIQGWRPWEKSTGAKTQAGKEVSKVNAHRLTIRGLCRASGMFCRGMGLLNRGRIEQAKVLHEAAAAYMENAPKTSDTPKAVYCRKRRRERAKAKP
jgi:hypothetical protein